MYLVYILKSKSCERTYVGMTNDFFKRWRQHNSEIKGGAKYTHKYKNWYPILILDGFHTINVACQCEWRLKRRCTQKGTPSQKRIIHTYDSIQQKQWTSNSPLIQSQSLTIYIDDDYKNAHCTITRTSAGCIAGLRKGIPSISEDNFNIPNSVALIPKFLS